MRVFVTGGTGFLGLHLVKTLIDDNIEVSCLIRKDTPLRKPFTYKRLIEWNVDLRSGDITDYNALCKALDDSYDYIFHLAGVVASRNKEDFERINVQGTRNLLQAILRADTSFRRLIYMSSISAVGIINSDRPLNEKDDLEPATPYGVSKFKGEQLVEEFHRDNDVPTTVVRAPMIYGYGEHLGLIKLSSVIARGRIIPIFSDEASMPLVYVKNLVDGITLCAEKSLRSFDKYIISDAKTYTFTEVAERIAECLKIKPFRLRMPTTFLKAASLKVGYLRYAVNNTRLSIDKAVKELKFNPKDSLKRGLKETVQYYVLRGLLKCGNYPLSPFDTLKIALNEQEGLGTAYEYYVKTKILTRYLNRAHEIRKALILSLPRIHGSVADITTTLNELGIDFATVEIPNEQSLKGLSEKYDVIIIVADLLKNIKKTISLLSRYSDMIILFTTNADNLFHVNKWNGTAINKILEVKPMVYNYLDCPPFPSGIKVFSGKNVKETKILKTLMLILAFWSKVEWKLPTTVKSKLSHMTAALHFTGD